MIELRHILPIDFNDMKSYVTNDQVTRFLTWDTYKNEEHVRGFLDKATGLNKFPNEFLGIIYKNKMIGTVHMIERKNKIVQFGFGILPVCWGRGLGAEIVKNVISYLKSGEWIKFVNLVVADIHKDNVHAIRVLEQCGFTKSIRQKVDSSERLRYSCPL